MTFLLKLCDSLNKNKIEYAVAGGWAIALHQIPRATFDVDLVVHLSEKNFKNLEDLLNDLGLVSKLPVTAQQVYHFKDEYIQNKNLIAWSFSNPIKPSEIVDILLTEEKNNLDVIYKTVGNIKIPVLSPQSLIQLKTKSNRPQDQEDIKWLKKLL